MERTRDFLVEAGKPTPANSTTQWRNEFWGGFWWSSLECSLHCSSVGNFLLSLDLMLRVFGKYVRFRKNIGHAGTKLEQWKVVASLQVVDVIRFSERKRWCVFFTDKHYTLLEVLNQLWILYGTSYFASSCFFNWQECSSSEKLVYLEVFWTIFITTFIRTFSPSLYSNLYFQ